MLARVNRLVRGTDYRNVVRHGRKVGSRLTVMYVVKRDDEVPARFGFIVAKTVGNAVVRNRVRRRLKAASFELLASGWGGSDVVIRALPSSAAASWTNLRSEVFNAAERIEARQ